MTNLWFLIASFVFVKNVIFPLLQVKDRLISHQGCCRPHKEDLEYRHPCLDNRHGTVHTKIQIHSTNIGRDTGWNSKINPLDPRGRVEIKPITTISEKVFKGPTYPISMSLQENLLIYPISMSLQENLQIFPTICRSEWVCENLVREPLEACLKNLLKWNIFHMTHFWGNV